jgi:Calx-beta domain
MTFTVTLSVAYDQPVTVNLATADGTAKVSDNDYAATSGTLTFAPGQTKTITVQGKGDKKKEPDEYFYLLLSDPSSDALISNGSALGWILNDD